ncbi:uncharacterized protein LOC113234614 [Hyposmocoma kahamanoa]|uniref:uncharacterized protein LOC113234614 n=1 Tax=Hyposmocoma kahamanoa TaxID=1477025 RepID=UPI000E6D8A35|nr:uncharacterized protein LOC113234614 [Hyposmocoma kahamanoa]
MECSPTLYPQTIPYCADTALVIREHNGWLSHTVYRKPTHTDRYLRAGSHHYPAHLASVPRTHINRVLKLCDPDYIDVELNHVKDVLVGNGYKWKQSWRVANASTRPRPESAERVVAYLPYVRGVTDVIGNLLRRRYSINTIFRPLTQLRQLLRSPKDRDPLGVPGVYMVPCDCGKCYVGETRRDVATRLAEHIRSMKNQDVNGSAVADHFLSSGAGHYIRFDKAKVLAREKYFVPRKIREAIEISRRPNFNRTEAGAYH